MQDGALQAATIHHPQQIAQCRKQQQRDPRPARAMLAEQLQHERQERVMPGERAIQIENRQPARCRLGMLLHGALDR